MRKGIRPEETILGMSPGWYKGASTQRGRADGKAFQKDKAKQEMPNRTMSDVFQVWAASVTGGGATDSRMTSRPEILQVCNCYSHFWTDTMATAQGDQRGNGNSRPKKEAAWSQVEM